MRHAIRLGIGFVILVTVALVEFRVWLKYAYAIYGVVLLLLIYVEVAGEIGMGAQRWIDLKFIQLQPSEMMKIALVLALARRFMVPVVTATPEPGAGWFGCGAGAGSGSGAGVAPTLR